MERRGEEKGWKEKRGRRRCRCWSPAGYDPRGEHTTPETASVWESAPAPSGEVNLSTVSFRVPVAEIDEECAPLPPQNEIIDYDTLLLANFRSPIIIYPIIFPFFYFIIRILLFVLIRS